MKLTDTVSRTVVVLPDEMYWSDEFKWGAGVGKSQYTLTGDLVIQTSKRNAGRPITLEYPDENQAWVPRSTVETLLGFLNNPDRRYLLKLEYPTDTRQFAVVFRHWEGAIESSPVKGFAEHTNDAWFRLKLKMMEVV